MNHTLSDPGFDKEVPGLGPKIVTYIEKQTLR